MPNSGWLSRDLALAIAHDLMRHLPHVKSIHVQGMGTGGRLKISVFLKPLGSKDIPEPEAYIFGVDDLIPSKIRLP